MSQTGLRVFDTTLQTTNHWLHELMAELGWDDRHRAYQALRAVLHALRDHLTVVARVEEGARAVFRVLARHVTAGAIEDVKHRLPHDLRRLWP